MNLSCETKSSHYPVILGSHILSSIRSHVRGNQVFIVTQKNIAAHFLSLIENELKDIQCDHYFLPQGEEFKNFSEWQKILDALIQNNHHRDTTIIALGGGMVGDMAAFAAACYERGVDYVHVPTSLIAQVDSSIGGKCGINHTAGKNRIGAFYQPRCVLIDVATLKTLPEREFISGIAEIIKYGLIIDAEFFSWLEKNMDLIIKKNLECLQYAIQKSVSTKIEVVSRDERDEGLRQILNFGHTFGHALETVFEYQIFLHGEAVALGILFAAILSLNRQLITKCEYNRIFMLLKKAGLLKTGIDNVKVDQMISLMKQDKKNAANAANSKLHAFILLKSIGTAFKVTDVTEEELLATFKKITSSNLEEVMT